MISRTTTAAIRIEVTMTPFFFVKRWACFLSIASSLSLMYPKQEKEIFRGSWDTGSVSCPDWLPSATRITVSRWIPLHRFKWRPDWLEPSGEKLLQASLPYVDRGVFISVDEKTALRASQLSGTLRETSCSHMTYTSLSCFPH